MMSMFVWVTNRVNFFFFDVHMHHTADTNSVSHGEYVTCYSADHNDYNKKTEVPRVFSCSIHICGSN